MQFSPVDPALAALEQSARTQPQRALREAAREFEKVFVQMLLKSLREASPRFDPLASGAERLFQDLLDREWAELVARRGVGLAPLVERQLARNLRAPAPAQESPPAAVTEERAQVFLRTMSEPAKAAARATGLPPAFVLGQAALESGWGAHEPRFADGRRSHNVFGIKAGAGWRGPAVEAVTTEYVNGVAERRVERFRAYGSYAEAFADWARLIGASRRYAAALTERSEPVRYAAALARAGYATDPRYADKLARAIDRVQRSLA